MVRPNEIGMKMKDIKCYILPITLAYRAAVYCVAREKKFLSYLEGPPFAISKTFVEENIKVNWPH